MSEVNTAVILAAGRGSRMGRIGDSLPKALVPLERKAALTHIIDKIPPSWKVVVVTGYKAPLIEEYMRLVHSDRPYTLVNVPTWDVPGSGPGTSLLAAREHVVGDLVVVSCDTLWRGDWPQFDGVTWMAYAPQPFGTHAQRWCRLRVDEERVRYIIDKRPGWNDVRDVWTGLGGVAAADLDTFWFGLTQPSPIVAGELQMTNGFKLLAHMPVEHTVRSIPLKWIDVGDEEAYRRAVAEVDGYDFSKPGQATYVMPQRDLVVKFHENTEGVTNSRYERALALGTEFVPEPLGCDLYFSSYRYVPGITAYAAACDSGLDLTAKVVHYVKALHTNRSQWSDDFILSAERFYRDKTYARLELLTPHLHELASDVIAALDWRQLAAGVRPGRWHGDLNYANLIVSQPDGRIVGIDWREDFDGRMDYGDQRYDVAKLIAGTRVHWSNAQRGDFRPWPQGPMHEKYLMEKLPIDGWTLIIGALTLINSAPLHAPPFDEVLVTRAMHWLEELL